MSSWVGKTLSVPARWKPKCRSRLRPIRYTRSEGNLSAAQQDSCGSKPNVPACAAALKRTPGGSAGRRGPVARRRARFHRGGWQPVLKLVDPASLWVKARFDQGRSAGLTPGLAADIVLRSGATTALRGKVARVELQGDSVTEERVAQIALTPSQRAFRSANWPRSHSSYRDIAFPVAAQCRHPTASGAGRRLVQDGGGLRLRRCVWARSAWTDRCRCWTA